MEDAPVSGTGVRTDVRVRIPPGALVSWLRDREDRYRPAKLVTAVRIRPESRWKVGRGERRRFAIPRSRRESCAGSIPAPSAQGWLTERQGARLETGGWGESPNQVQLLDHPPWIVKLPRSSHRLEPGWAHKRWGRDLRYPPRVVSPPPPSAGRYPTGEGAALIKR
jgi:hypothetical protein